MDKQEKINEILENRDKFRSLDVTVLEDYTEEPIPDPSPRFTKLMDIYYVMKNTIDMEYPYWYNRSWWQNEGDLPEIRRAKAEAYALEHMTPTIWPQELLVMNKTKNWRGAFCFPWVDASFFNAQAEALLAQADAPALAEADKMSVVGAGGGNVTKSFGTSSPSPRSSVSARRRSPSWSRSPATGTTAPSRSRPRSTLSSSPSTTSTRPIATPSSSCSTPGQSPRAARS